MCRCTNCKPIAFSRLKATVLKIDNCDLEIGLRRKEICMKTSYEYAKFRGTNIVDTVEL